MERKVKGTLFLGYVITVKSAKGVDLAEYLAPEELKMINQPILSSNWYPFDTYERMGMIILKESAKGDMEKVRELGRMAIDFLLQTYKNVVVEGNPLESIKKFEIVRSRFFNYHAIEVIPREDAKVHLKMNFGLPDLTEEAAAYQLAGSVERLLELAGARDLQSSFLQKAWQGDPHSIFEVGWD